MRLQHCFSSPLWASSRGPAHISYAPCPRLPPKHVFNKGRPPDWAVITIAVAQLAPPSCCRSLPSRVTFRHHPVCPERGEINIILVDVKSPPRNRPG